MIALFDRNGGGVPKQHETRRTTLASGYSARVKSFVVKRLRIVLMPLMHRVELRLRSAIEKTGLASNVFEVRTSVAGMQRKIDHLQLTCDDILARLQEARGATGEAPGKALQAGNVIQFGNQLVSFPTSFGHLVVVRSNPALLDFLLDGEAPYLGTVAVIEKFLEPGDRFVSIGAGTGLLEIVAARKLRDAGSVIVCEAYPESAEAMRVAVSMNGLAGNVKIHNFAIGTTRTGSATEHNDLDAAVLLLDSVLAAGEKIALIKIEMEGYELAALRAIRRLQHDNPRLAVIVKLTASAIRRSGSTSETWLQTVGEFGFNAYKIDGTDFPTPRVLAADFDLDRPVTFLLAQQSSQFVKRLVPAVGQP